MPSESGDRRPARPQLQPPKLVEPLLCPRCASTNTKFCYYNNYNLSQPRHFCKACRRYWTNGGTLRNVPVGGGTRKNSKRSRSSTCTSSNNNSSSSTITSASTVTHDPEALPLTTIPDSALSVLKTDKTENLNLNESFQLVPTGTKNGNVISLLNAQQGPPGGYMGMVGYGTGIGYGLCEVGFGGGGWTYPGMGFVSGGNGGGTEVGNNTGCNTWQARDGDHGFVDEENYCWPSLAISSAGKSLK